MRFLPALLSALALSSSTSVAQADVLVVSPTGTYTTIQQAVTAAVDDDVILVKTGTYPAFTVRGKALVIAEDTGHDVRVDGAIRVIGIDGTRELVLIGLESVGGTVTDLNLQYGLRVTNSSGLVLAQDCTFRSSLRATTAAQVISERRPALLVENSFAVVLSRCNVIGNDSIPGQSPHYPTAGLPYASGVPSEGAYLQRSGVSFFECTVTGGPGSNSFYDGTHGGHGIQSEGSALYLSGSEVRGGDGGHGNCFPSACLVGSLSGNGGDAVRAEGRSACISVGATTTGGVGGRFLNGTGTVANCQVLGCSPSTPGATGQAVRLIGASTLTPLGGPARKLTAPAILREGQGGQLNFEGALGDQVERYSSRVGTAFYELDSTSIRVPDFAPSFRDTRVGVIGPAPLFDPIPIPELGVGIKHRLLFYQGEHTTTSVRRLGTPRAVLLLDSAY